MYSKNLKSKADIKSKEQKRKNDGCLLVEASLLPFFAQNLLLRSGLGLITDCGVHARALVGDVHQQRSSCINYYHCGDAEF